MQQQIQGQNLEGVLTNLDSPRQNQTTRQNPIHKPSLEEDLAQVDSLLSELQKPIREPTDQEIFYKSLKDTYQATKKFVIGTLQAIPGPFFANTYVRKKFNNNKSLAEDNPEDYGIYAVVGGLGVFGSILIASITSILLREYEPLSRSLNLFIPLSIVTNTLSAVYEYARYKNLKKYQDKN